jgi:hypothetical protein
LHESFSRSEVGPFEMHSPEVGFDPEVRPEMRSPEVGALQMRSPEAGRFQMRFVEPGPFEMRYHEVAASRCALQRSAPSRCAAVRLGRGRRCGAGRRGARSPTSNAVDPSPGLPRSVGSPMPLSLRFSASTSARKKRTGLIAASCPARRSRRAFAQAPRFFTLSKTRARAGRTGGLRRRAEISFRILPP